MQKTIRLIRCTTACFLVFILLLSTCACGKKKIPFDTNLPPALESTSEPENSSQVQNTTSVTEKSEEEESSKLPDIPPITNDPETPPVTPSQTKVVTINGAPLSDWVIGVDPSVRGSIALAEEIVDYFFGYSREYIKIVTPKTMTDTPKNIIAIGALGRSLIATYDFDGEYYVARNDERGSEITLLSGTSGGLEEMVDRFLADVQKTTNEDGIFFTVPEKEDVYFSAEASLSKWTLLGESRREFCDGVTYIDQHFIDADNKPYRTYAVILDPAKVELCMGASNDGYELVPTEHQTTLQHLQAAVSNGKNVVVGVNANYFNIDGDYSPNGLALKDGVLISPSRSDLPFFAITDEGEMIIDEGYNYNLYVTAGKNFVQGVAAGPILLKNGLLTTAGKNTGAKHPRTLIGLTEDGKILLGVIDGRQETISNGSTHARSALWMRSLGAVTVMNLDGGGSSTFVLRDPETGHCGVYNSPSDGNVRKVHNSLLVILK